MMSVYFQDYYSTYRCEYYLVLSTKYGRKIIADGIFAYLKLKLLEITKNYPQILFRDVYHDEDYLCMVVTIPPVLSVGKVVKIIKNSTSREIKQKFPFLKFVFPGSERIWSDGYFVSTEYINSDTIGKYIDLQMEEDMGSQIDLF
jgi:putative transposase